MWFANKYFLPFCHLSFHSLNRGHWWAKVFNFSEVQLTHFFSFMDHTFVFMAKNSSTHPRSWRFCISSNCFIVSCLIFGPMICFELMFVWSMRFSLRLISLQVDRWSIFPISFIETCLYWSANKYVYILKTVIIFETSTFDLLDNITLSVNKSGQQPVS